VVSAGNGEIRVDGLPLTASVSFRYAERLPGSIRLCSSGTALLDNLSYGAPADPSLPFGQVIAQAHLRSVLSGCPGWGLQTRLGEGGA
jgi:hypothetical protein